MKPFYMTVIALFFAGMLSACDKQGPAESAGEDVDNMAEETGEKIDETVEETKEKLE